MSRAKRGATTDLNHDNWDQEEDKEEAGVFKQAPPEEISRRVIKQAVRRRPVAANTDNTAGEINQNVFGSLNMKSFPIFEAKPTASFKTFNFLGSSESKVSNNIPIINQDNKQTVDQVAKNVFESFVHGKPTPEAKPVAAVPSFDFLSGVQEKKSINQVTRISFESSIHVAKNVFESFVHGKATPEAKPAATAPSFDFLSGVKDGNSSITNNCNGIKEVTATVRINYCPGEGTEPKSVHEKTLMKNDDKEKKTESLEETVLRPADKSSNANQRTPVFSTPSSLRDFVEPTYRKYSHLISKPTIESKKIPGPNISGRSEAFLQNMAEINESFSTWIQRNLAEDPTSILTRCFKDYIRHVQALFDEEKKGVVDENRLEVIRKQERVLNELVVHENPQTMPVKDSDEFDE